MSGNTLLLAAGAGIGTFALVKMASAKEGREGSPIPPGNGNGGDAPPPDDPCGHIDSGRVVWDEVDEICYDFSVPEFGPYQGGIPQPFCEDDAGITIWQQDIMDSKTGHPVPRFAQGFTSDTLHYIGYSSDDDKWRELYAVVSFFRKGKRIATKQTIVPLPVGNSSGYIHEVRMTAPAWSKYFAPDPSGFWYDGMVIRSFTLTEFWNGNIGCVASTYGWSSFKVT